MAKQSNKMKEQSLAALNQFEQTVRKYTANANWFETYCRVKYTFGDDEMTADCHIDVQMNNPIGRIRIQGGRINEGNVPVEFRFNIDQFEFINNILIIKGSQGKQYKVEIGEYAEGSRIIPD